MATDKDDGAWFAPKRYGLGAGLPITWQGWAVFAATIAIVVAVGILLADKPLLQAAIIFPLIVLLLIVTARKTRGGWRWRWGEED